MEFYPEKVIQIREQKKMPMSKLAKHSGVSRTALWAWETGKTIPSPANVRAIANTLEVNVSDISNLKGIKNITYNSFSDSLTALHSLSSLTKQITPDKVRTIKDAVNAIEEELYYSSIAINAIISSLDFAFYIKDVNQKYILANKAFLKMVGKDENPVISGRKDNFFFSIKEASSNSTQDEEVIAKGIICQDMEGYLPGTRKSRWGLISKLPVFDKNKDITGVIGIFKDTTEKKKAEQKRVFLEKALDYINEGVWIGELLEEEPYEFKAIYVNKSFETMTNLKKETVYKNPVETIQSILSPEDYRERVNLRKKRKYPIYLKYKIKNKQEQETEVAETLYKIDDSHTISIIKPALPES